MRAILPCVVLVALTACAGEVQVSRQYIPQRGVPGQADYAAAVGPVPVVLANNPFPPGDVIAALSQNNPRRHRFTAEPPASLQGGYRVVLAFDPGSGAAYGCRTAAPGSAPAAGPRDGRQSVYGAFCLGPTLLSEAVATGPRAPAAGDPAFARLMGDLLSAIMPFRDPHDTVVED